MKFVLTFALLSWSLASFAGFKCSSKVMTKTIGNTYVQSSLSKTMKLPKDQEAGEYRGVVLHKIGLLGGNSEYALNAVIECQDECSLVGTVTEVSREGFLNQYRVSLRAHESEYYPMSENKVLIMSCKE